MADYLSCSAFLLGSGRLRTLCITVPYFGIGWRPDMWHVESKDVCKGSVFPHCGWAAAFNRSSSFVMCGEFKWLVGKLVGINDHSVCKCSNRSHALRQKAIKFCFFVQLYTFKLCYFTLWSWVVFHHDYSCSTTSCAAWSTVLFIRSRPSGQVASYPQLWVGLLFSSLSCDWDIYMQGGVHPVIYIFYLRGKCPLKSHWALLWKDLSDSSLMWPSWGAGVRFLIL